jgi:hypothetical protein
MIDGAFTNGHEHGVSGRFLERGYWISCAAAFRSSIAFESQARTSSRRASSGCMQQSPFAQNRARERSLQ